VGQWLAQAVGRPPVAGDRVRLGSALLVVRALEQGRISGVGLILEE